MSDGTRLEEKPVTTRERLGGLVFVVIAAGVIVGLGLWFVFSFVLTCGCTKPADGAAIDQARAGQIARDYFATAHGTGIKLTDVRETDLGVTNDTACESAWEVLMEGTVTESTGASFGSHMYLCVDPTSGAVTRGPAG